MLLCFRNCLSTPDGWYSFMGLHWLKNWDSNTHPDILQQVVCSLLEAVRAERTAMCFVPGRIYSSYNLHLGLLSSFSWVFRALKGDSPFSFLLFWNCSLQYDHDLSQRGGKNKPISTASELLSEKKKVMTLVSFTWSRCTVAQTFLLLKDSHGIIQKLVLKYGNFSHRHKTCVYCSSIMIFYWLTLNGYFQHFT